MPRGGPSKYQPLADYLAALPPETEAVSLSFAAVERIVRKPLPSSAWLSDWWSYPRQAAVWRSVGWRRRSVGRVEGRPTITFERVPDTTE